MPYSISDIYNNRKYCLIIIYYPSIDCQFDLKNQIFYFTNYGGYIMNNLFYDGFNSKLIETAYFEGILEIPMLEKQKEKIIPTAAIPFSCREKIKNPKEEMMVFYEHDPAFRDFISVPQNFMKDFKNIEIISTPDCSLYRDMPLWEQIANIGVSRSVGYYLQKQGKYVIPNVRWGDYRTYRKGVFDFIPAFSGIPQNSVVSIGTYGCSQSKEDKYFLEAGLDAMLAELMPSDVIVYGSYNHKIFDKYENCTRFHHLPDWTTYVHKKRR